MPLPTIYNTGTASVANGATTLTIVGAVSNAIYAGDLFCDPAQPLVPPQRIASVTGGGVFELAVAWPGTSMTADPYEVRITPDSVRVQERTRQVLEQLGQLQQLGIQPNAFGEFVDRDAYDDEAAGFIFLSVNGDAGVTTTAWTLFIKETAASADWDAGQTMEGAPGPQGDPGENVVWLTGSGAPSGGTGADGDMYLDTATGAVYGPKAAGAWGVSVANIKGPQGDPGNDGTDGTNGTNGTNGADGSDGTDPGILMTWDVANDDSDPGTGKIKSDNDALGSATLLYIDKANRGGSDIAAFLLALDDSTTTSKGILTLTDPVTEDQVGWTVTGVTDATGYVKVAVSGHFGETAIADTTPVSLQFSRTGDKGSDGAGVGDVVGPASSVNNRAAAFDGTTGKLLKDSGIVLGTAAAAATGDFATAAQGAKVDFITVTQPVDLDAIETRVNALDAAVVLTGTWDASTGTFPGGGTAQAGESWIVSVAGTVNSVAFALNDRIIAITDNASTTTFAANWFKADYTDQVLSVDGSTGAVTVGAIIAAAAGKTTPVDADSLALSDSAASNATKKLTWANLKAGILAYFNGTSKGTPIDADRVWQGDSTTSNTPVYSTWTQIKAFLKTYFDTLYQALDAQLSSLIRQNSQSAAYTLVLTDGGKHIYHPAADTTARIWTIPANSSVAFPIGTAVTFDNDFGAGAITIAITTDTLVLVGAAGSTGSRTLASGGQATAIKVTSTRWRISGVGLT